MSQVTFETAMQMENSQNNQGNNQYSYFSLKNDKDFAIVRFMESNVSDFKLLTCHDVQINNRYRKLNCIRNANDPIDMCPACKANMRATTRYFAKMLMYTPNEQGGIDVKPVIWERSLKYASQVRDLIMNYGDLTKCLFKITRNGAAGDMNTNYSIIYCTEQMYPQENYPIIEGVFNDFEPLGVLVMNKNADEISTYLATGNFPAPIPKETIVQPQNTMPMQAYTAPQPNVGVNTQIYSTPVEQVPVQNPQPVVSTPQQVTQSFTTPINTVNTVGGTSAISQSQPAPWEVQWSNNVDSSANTAGISKPKRMY